MRVKNNNKTNYQTMDYLNDFAPGILSELKDKTLEDFISHCTKNNFIKARGSIDFDPLYKVNSTDEVVLSFKNKDNYEELEKIDNASKLNAIEAFYKILTKQLDINPRACYFVSIEPINRAVIENGEVKRIPLYAVNFKR